MNTPLHRLFSKFISLFDRALPCNLHVGAAFAREVEGIAAIVNDEVISLYDVDQRVELYFVPGIVRANRDACANRPRELWMKNCNRKPTGNQH